MSKVRDLAASFVRKTRSDSALSVENPPMSAFGSIFSITDLDPKENDMIRSFLQMSGESDSESLDIDLDHLIKITKEVKSIRKQEILLVGERLKLAKGIFKKYQERSFRDWMEWTFGSFKTGYNYLAFYELYIELPNEIQSYFKSLPSRIAYALASKRVSLQEKIDLIQSHKNLGPSSRDIFYDGDLKHSAQSVFSVDKSLRDFEKLAKSLISAPLNNDQKNKLISVLEYIKTAIVL